MTSDSEANVPHPEGPVRSPASWVKSIGLYLVIAVPLVVISSEIVWLLLLVGIALSFIAVPYTAFVTVRLVRLRRAAVEHASSAGDAAEPRAARFRTTSQQLSLINAAALGTTAVVGLSTVLLIGDSALWIYAGAIFAVLSVVEIAVNAPWIYSKRTANAEAHAIHHRDASRTLILLNRGLSWIIWYVGVAVAIALVVFYIAENTG